jgi:hypothetical protein
MLLRKKINFIWLPLIIFLFIPTNQLLYAQSGTLRINEFMALNQSTLADEDGEYSDWIEIYNPTDQPVNLAGWALTDDKNLPGKWIFPDVTLENNSYLLVFASDKNRNIPGNQLHTNFKLSGDGEYFALINPQGIAVTEFDPFFPVQQTDISFGYFESVYISFLVPTPGTVNLQSGGTLLQAPVINYEHGFYNIPINLEMMCNDQDASIYYTTDGSLPDATNGTLFTDPVSIVTTSIIRAIAIKDNNPPSKVTTRTYLFLNEIIQQPNNPTGYPTEWGPYYSLAGTAIADYEMDPEMMIDPEFANSVKEALLDIPTMSLVTDKGYLFSHSQDPDTGGIYIYTGPSDNSPGAGWERPVSFEYFDSKDSVSFQVDCGVQIQGGAGRLPEKSPKHSFRLVFKSIYGPSRLNYPLFGDDALSSYNTIVLRAGFGNSWIHWSHSERSMAQYLRDRWAKDTHRAMGYNSSHGIYVHLYINGMYWGIYNPSERMDNDFAASYLGGDADDFDVIKDYAEAVDGNISAWNNMMVQANAGLASSEAYQRIQGNYPDGTPNPSIESMVDVENLADYMLINFYGGNWDWDHHNWVAIRNRVNPGTGFKFLCWDAEHILESVNANELAENNNNCPSRVFQQLLKNEDFSRMFADRIQKYCFNNEVLTAESAAERWIQRANQIDRAIVAESARWGDYRRDVHQWQTAGPFDLYTKEAYWLPQMDYMLNTYFPNRTDVFINQLRNAGLFPGIDAPRLFINNNPIVQKTISTDDILTMSTYEGEIYYTTDGSDPVIWQPSQSYNEKIIIAESSSKWVYVPKSDIGTKWSTDFVYNYSGWKMCSGSPGGVGYEKGTGYENLISLDVGNDMHSTGVDPNTSCYIRIPFIISAGDLSSAKSLFLGVRYDDGFVAYLNGKEVAAENAPASIQWNSASSGGHEAGTSPVIFNISEYLVNLKEGENIFAIQALNTAPSSTDFIINAELKISDRPAATISSSAIHYTGPVTLTESVHIKARTYSSGEWSATADQFLVLPDNFHDIKITEIHYHPSNYGIINNNELEFIELKNTGTSTLYLKGIRFVEGIEYEFSSETQLGPKEFIVLASNSDYFYDRYRFVPFGEYKGQLDNSGERILLISAEKDTLCSIMYSDLNGWPAEADGGGNSLVPVEYDPVDDQDNPDFWRASYHLGGSPGADDKLIPDAVENVIAPQSFTLSQNYPNPFSNITYIKYYLYEDSEVQLSVYNIMGQHVITLVNSTEIPGSYTVEWNGLDQNGNNIANGIYFCRIIVRNNGRTSFHTAKMMLLR